MDTATLALRAKLGGLAKSRKYDAREATAPARAAFMARWEKLVDPDGALEPKERARRAEAEKKLYYVRLGMQSGKRRRARANRREGQRARLEIIPATREAPATTQPDASRQHARRAGDPGRAKNGNGRAAPTSSATQKSGAS